MMRRISSREFSFVRGSDVQRDGMYLEISETVGEKSTVVAEVFYSDVDHTMTFSTFVPDLPFELVEHIAQTTREKLAPVDRIEAAE